jgi:flagellar biosynthesis/type III secretory pathway chaperone
MSLELYTAAHALSAVLEEENAALAAPNLPKAAALLQRKQEAVEAFTAALSQANNAHPSPSLVELGRKLQEQARDNQRLLERGIAVQGRVLAIVASAAPPCPAASRYGAEGGVIQARRYQGPVALALRA